MVSLIKAYPRIKINCKNIRQTCIRILILIITYKQAIYRIEQDLLEILLSQNLKKVILNGYFKYLFCYFAFI